MASLASLADEGTVNVQIPDLCVTADAFWRSRLHCRLRAAPNFPTHLRLVLVEDP